MRKSTWPLNEERLMTDAQKHAQVIKEMLAKAVAEALDRKRRLGQYAVIVRDGKPYHLLPDEMGGRNRESSRRYALTLLNQVGSSAIIDSSWPYVTKSR